MPIPENPFANYRPPEGTDVFSASGKLAIVQFKLGQFAEGVEQSMLEDGAVERFVAGIAFRTHYDFRNVDVLASFTNKEAKLGIAFDAVAAGIEAALSAKQVSPASGMLGLEGDFYDRTRKIAIVSASFVETAV